MPCNGSRAVDHAALPLDAAAAEGCVKVALTIFGEPASKANQRQLVSFPDGKGGKRPALIKSKKARNYESDALLQIPPAARLQLEGPVRVTLRVFYASQRPDLDESVILDVLQDRYVGRGDERELVQKGVYRNDRQVREKHVFHAIDRANPRAEIEVEAHRSTTAGDGGMSMTQDQAQKLRVLMQEAFDLVLAQAHRLRAGGAGRGARPRDRDERSRGASCCRSFSWRQPRSCARRPIRPTKYLITGPLVRVPAPNRPKKRRQAWSVATQRRRHRP
jgi:hypothetical protein